MISYTINHIFYFYLLLMMIRIVLSWIPDIDWNSQPFKLVGSLVDPYLNIFRGIIPPIGGMLDISPILAFIVLNILQGLIVGFLSGAGL